MILELAIITIALLVLRWLLFGKKKASEAKEEKAFDDFIKGIEEEHEATYGTLKETVHQLADRLKKEMRNNKGE